MAVDIRRMSREELDELNRQGALWRARNKPAQNEPAPGEMPAQMDLWSESPHAEKEKL
jgi:hypothetical protein